MSYFASIRDEKLPGKLSNIANGPRGRKLLTGDKMGILSLINSKSGELLDRLEKASTIFKREEADSKNKSKKSYEVTNLIFNEDQKILFTTSCDSIVRLYKLDTHSSEKLREYQGGHNSSEITAADYCPQTLIFYTGAANGTIAMWSLESSSLMNVLRESSDEVTAIKHLFPYPAILVGDTRGVINCWQGKDTHNQGLAKQKTKVGDLSWLLFSIHVSSLIPTRIAHPIRSLITFSTNHEIEPLRDLLDQPTYDQIVESRRSLLPTARLNFASYQDSQAFLETPNNEMASRSQTESPLSVQKLSNQVMDGSSNWIKSSSAVMVSEREIKSNSKKLILYCASQSGSITGFDVDQMLRGRLDQLNQREYNSKRWERFHTNIYRHDNLDGRRTFIAFLREEHSGIGFLLSSAKVFLDKSVSLISWVAHHKLLNSINSVHSPHETIISCSENELRIWSLSGESYCNLNMLTLKATEWNIPYNFLDSLLSKLENAVNMLAHISNQKFSQAQQEQIMARFMWSNFVWPQIIIDRRYLKKVLHFEHRAKRFASVEQKFKDGKKRIWNKSKKAPHTQDLDINNLTMLEQATLAPSTPTYEDTRKWTLFKDKSLLETDFSVSARDSIKSKQLGFKSTLAKQLNTRFNQMQFEQEEKSRQQHMKQSTATVRRGSIQKSFTMQIPSELRKESIETKQRDESWKNIPNSMPMDGMKPPQTSNRVSVGTPESKLSQEGPRSLKYVDNSINTKADKRTEAASKMNTLASNHRKKISTSWVPPPKKVLNKAETLFVDKKISIGVGPVTIEIGRAKDKMFHTQMSSSHIKKPTRNLHTLQNLNQEQRSRSAVSRPESPSHSQTTGRLVSTQGSFYSKKQRLSGLPKPIVTTSGISQKIIPQTTRNIAAGTIVSIATHAQEAAKKPTTTRGASLNTLLTRVNARYRNSSSQDNKRKTSQLKLVQKDKLATTKVNQTLPVLAQTASKDDKSIEEIQQDNHPQGVLVVNKGFFTRTKGRIRNILG